MLELLPHHVSSWLTDGFSSAVFCPLRVPDANNKIRAPHRSDLGTMCFAQKLLLFSVQGVTKWDLNRRRVSATGPF